MKKARDNKSKDKKTNHLLYVLCAVDIIVVLVAAFFLPQMIFVIQDRYRMLNTEMQARNSLNISQLNMDYEQDLNARLQNYLNMNSRIVTAIDYEFSEDSEVAKLLETIFQEEWFTPLYYDYFVETVYDYKANYEEVLALRVAECRKYLIHNGNYQDGVALMMWYVDLNIEPADMRIRLLIDTESHTIYYMKIAASEEYNVGKKYLAEKMHYMLDNIHSYCEFYYNYYETDKEKPFLQYYADNAAAGNVELEIGDEHCRSLFHFPYGWTGLEFLFQAEYKDGTHAEITMGLPAIGEMIPEMIQD